MVRRTLTGTTAAWLLLDVAGVPCALPADAVREILPLPHLHALPATGGPLAGVLNLGGVPVPVIDLARLLGLRDGPPDADPYRHVILLDAGDLALLADRAADVVQIDDDALRPVAAERSLNGCVEAEIAIGSRLVHALSPHRLLTAEEHLRVAALDLRAADRLSGFPVASPA